MTYLSYLTKNDEEFKNIADGISRPEVTIGEPSIKPKSDYTVQEYSIIGTAYDYLVRFEIERQNKCAESEGLVAETARHRYEDSSQIIKYLDNSIREYEHYVSKECDKIPIESSIDLAKIDQLVRPGDSKEWVKRYLGVYEDSMKSELYELIEETPEWMMNATDYALLNPVVGIPRIKADADLIIDNKLIDLKTTINPRFKVLYWRQLVGYLALIDVHIDRNDLIQGVGISKIDKIGIYFSRNSQIREFDASRIYDDRRFRELKEYILEY